MSSSASTGESFLVEQEEEYVEKKYSVIKRRMGKCNVNNQLILRKGLVEIRYSQAKDAKIYRAKIDNIVDPMEINHKSQRGQRDLEVPKP